MNTIPYMTPEIKHTHEGVEITYIEGINKWQFTVRGRERQVDSLTAAKVIIEKPEPKERPPFERFKAYYRGGYWASGNAYEVVDVTSIAVTQRYGHPQVWIVTPSKRRERVEATRVFPVCAENTALVKEITALQERDKLLRQKIDDIEKSLTPVKIPKEN